MTLQERLDTLVGLGEYIGKMEGRLEFVIRQAYVNNAWFVVDNIKRALSAIETQFLNREKLQNWLDTYEIAETTQAKKIGLILAGNIPLVGFQDIVNVFVAGHHSIIKLSDKDKYLVPHLLKVLSEINPKAADYFTITERLTGFDGVIATGSNNSARYFEAYFGKYPHIIRKNRNGIAVFNGSESQDDFRAFNDDVFTYFGLGCRNIAKVYVPRDYDFNQMLETLHERKTIVNHGKYKNNFDYNLAFHILNRTPYYNNGCIILVESEAIPSRIAQLNFEYYDNSSALAKQLATQHEQIQCIVSNTKLENLDVIPFGSTQQPSLMDYADGVDTMQFLISL